jgi:hypothetical protein
LVQSSSQQQTTEVPDKKNKRGRPKKNIEQTQPSNQMSGLGSEGKNPSQSLLIDVSGEDEIKNIIA